MKFNVVCECGKFVSGYEVMTLPVGQHNHTKKSFFCPACGRCATIDISIEMMFEWV